MVLYLRMLDNPQIKAEKYFEVMRDFRKGGINPDMYDEFIKTAKQLPDFQRRNIVDYQVFDKFNLSNITENDFSAIQRELMKRAVDESKVCWHPSAGQNTCMLDKRGKIAVTAAHSIQNNGVLSKIAENGHVFGYSLDKSGFEEIGIGKNRASIFWGFCNTHDSIFSPIETTPYIGSDEQHFLFAYRAFVFAYHKKREAASVSDFGVEWENDLNENKKIFDQAILDSDYSVVETRVFELPAFYPLATSSSANLEFDFNGQPIFHSDSRMENIFFTLYPTDRKTYFFVSFFKQDAHLYRNLVKQITERTNLKLDISILLSLAENTFFNPTYFNTFIKKHTGSLLDIMKQSGLDSVTTFPDGTRKVTSLTPRDMLQNTSKINFFGY